tara:strand:- start:141 stop:551 length:411 start_codon:yes stop_codon:yes gene_type:complete
MTVLRISKDALDKILAGKVNTNATCMIKFYSPTCHMCKALSPYYKDIANKYEDDIHFFAMNIEDYFQAQSDLGFEGVPTILGVKMHKKAGKQKEFNYKPKILKMPEPTHEDSHPDTWYYPEHIEEFIEKRLLRRGK